MASATLDFVSAHAAGMAGIGYGGKGDSLKVISCGQDGQLCTQKADDLSDKITKSMQAEAVACHCLAVSPMQDNFAVGDQAHFVKVCCCICDCKSCYFWQVFLMHKCIECLSMHVQIYKLPDGTFNSVATRFSLPVRALAYSPSGTNLAAAGDDEGIKLISAAESKVRGLPYEQLKCTKPQEYAVQSAQRQKKLMPTSSQSVCYSDVGLDKDCQASNSCHSCHRSFGLCGLVPIPEVLHLTLKVSSWRLYQQKALFRFGTWQMAK